MADNLGARKDGLPYVIHKYFSFDFTPGSPYPIPYPVANMLSDSENVSENVFYNGNAAFKADSYVTHVWGDEAGVDGGMFSGTFTQKAEPISYSMSVFVNGANAVRGYDPFYMNKKNTTGTLILIPPPAKGAITDTGKVAEAEAAPEIPSFMEFF